MLSKNDVYSFVEKVQHKAIKSLQENYKIELDKAIELALNEPVNHVLKKAINAVIFNSAEGHKAKNIIRKYIPKCDRYDNYFGIKDVKHDLFGTKWDCPTGFGNISAVHAEWSEKITRTKDEYAKITRIVKNKKTGEQGKTALIALGFDVTWLDNLSNLPVVINPTEVVIDKALIFPCGESGV